MEEEVKKPEEEQGEEVVEEPKTAIDRAEALMVKLEQKEKELKEKERVIAEKMLSSSAGGAEIPKDPKVLTPKEYAEYVIKYGKAPNHPTRS